MIWLCGELEYAADKGYLIKLNDTWNRYTCMVLAERAEIEILRSFISRRSTLKDNCWWQGWLSGESTCLPLMWPGFDFRTRRQMWIEFVGSLLCSERFFFKVFRFSPLTKNQHLI